MENTDKRIELIDVNNQSIEMTFGKIQEYINTKGYSLKGSLKIPTNAIGFNKSLSFDSKKHKKVVRNYINLLHKQISMRVVNKFLHFLFKKVYKLDDAPSVDYSEREIKIQVARRAWKEAFAKSEKLRIAYRTEKGDFYRPKQTSIAA